MKSIKDSVADSLKLEQLYPLISRGVKHTGTYDPNEVLPYFEEYLTGDEYALVHSFLTYVHQNSLSFGSGNFAERAIEFVKQR